MNAMMRSWDKGALICVLSFAATLRLIGINAGLPLAWNIDEVFVMDHALTITVNDLNPHAFVYGGLTFYLPRFVTWVAAFIATRGINYPWTWSNDYLTARLLAAGLGIATMACAFEMGRKLAGRRAGLFSALLFAFSPLAVDLSHFYTADPLMGFWAALSFVAMIAWLKGNDRAASLAAVAAGLAIGSKYNAAILLIPIAVIAFRRDAARLGSLSPTRRFVLVGAILTSALAFLSVLVFQNQLLNLAATWTNTGEVKPVYLQIFHRLLVATSMVVAASLVLLVGVLRNQPLALRIARYLTSTTLLKPLLLALVVFLIVAPFTLVDFPSFAQGFFYALSWQVLGNVAAFPTDSIDFRLITREAVNLDPLSYVRDVQAEWGWLIFGAMFVGIWVMWKRAHPAFVPFVGVLAVSLAAISFGRYQPLRYLYLFGHCLPCWAEWELLF